jgi:hypothetical protein
MCGGENRRENGQGRTGRRVRPVQTQPGEAAMANANAEVGNMERPTPSVGCVAVMRAQTYRDKAGRM